MVQEYQLFINNEFVAAESKETFDNVNPHNGEVIGKFARGKKADVNKAVQAARKAFDEGPWPKMTGEERAKLIQALADKIAEKTPEWLPLECQDSGSTMKKLQGDFFLASKVLGYFAKLAVNALDDEISEASKEGVSKNILVREPIGVCAQIIPWNFPVNMAIWKLGPALATGCTVILKPAEETPWVAMELAKEIKGLGFPPGVINIVTGFGAEAGEALVKHPGVDKVAFTGSTEIGKLIMSEAACSMKRVTLECGGKSANIFLEDADPEIAIDGALFAAFFHSGQCCTAGTRLLLPESKKKEFLDALVARAKDMKIGNPADKSTDIGPLVSKKQWERVMSYIEKGKAEGATLLMGGKKPDDAELANGFYIEPVIFDNVKPDMTIAQEEIFGPVLSVITYKTEAQALDIANNSIYGLGGAVWSKDTNKALNLARKLKAGTVWVNEYHILNEKAPFGGYKQSGIGRELGKESLRAYTEVKHIHVDEIGKREKKFWYDSVAKPKSLAKT